MTRSFSFLLSGLLLCLVSCTQDIPNNEAPNSLNASPAKVTLSSKDTATASFTLACGCTFQLTLDKFWGDTNSIKWQPARFLDTNKVSHLFPIDSTATPHPVWFYAGKTPKAGIDTVWLAFHGGAPPVLYDTIMVIMSVP